MQLFLIILEVKVTGGVTAAKTEAGRGIIKVRPTGK